MVAGLGPATIAQGCLHRPTDTNRRAAARSASVTLPRHRLGLHRLLEQGVRQVPQARDDAPLGTDGRFDAARFRVLPDAVHVALDRLPCPQLLRAALPADGDQATGVVLGERVDQLDGHALVIKTLIVRLGRSRVLGSPRSPVAPFSWILLVTG